MARRPWRKNSATAGSCRSLYTRMSSAVKSILFLTKKYVTNKNICLRRMWRKKRISASCPSAAIVGANEGLVTEILALLPVKSVVRLKSVNKQWSSIISSEYFTRLHAENHGRRLRFVETRHKFIMQGDVRGRAHEFFICDPCTVNSLVRVSLPSPIQQQPVVKILQSWNGLLLLSLGKDRIHYVVFNPTTEQYRFIHLDQPPYAIHLVSEPSKSEYYKILLITSEDPFIYSVYDSTTQECSHGMELDKDGCPFTEDALGFRMSLELSQNIIFSSFKEGKKHYHPELLVAIRRRRVYDNSVLASHGHLNLVQVKPLEENKLSLRVGLWFDRLVVGNMTWLDEGWRIQNSAIIDFNSTSTGRACRLLGMMREKGKGIKDAVFLFHVPGRLLTYRMSGNQGLKVLLSRKKEGVKVLVDMDDHELQFGAVHPFIRTFAPV